MKIIIDTREQLPLPFDEIRQLDEIRGIYVEDTLHEALSVGDYGAVFKDGHRPPYYFERKSIGDLYGTMSKGYSRFKKEIDRCRAASSSLIIAVEGTWTDVAAGYSWSKKKPSSLTLQLATLYIKYGVDTWFCSSRTEMMQRIVDHYVSYGKRWKNERMHK